MYRVFVAQNRGGALHIEHSQNVLFSIRKINRKLEKRKKRDRWRLVWFSESFEMKDARRVVEKLKRVNNLQAMRKVMEEHKQKEMDEQSSALDSHIADFADMSSGF